MKRQWLLGVPCLLILLLLSACGGTTYNVAGSQRVQVKLSEYKINTSLTSFVPGKPYHFMVMNIGRTTHEFMIMPKAEEIMSNTSMRNMDMISLASVENISPGETKFLDYTFPPSASESHPQFACYYPGHYEAGMKQDVRVSS